MSELSSIELSCIKKNDNYFSFTTEVINEIGNSTFLQNASDFILHQHNNISNDTCYSYVWSALCACADEIGSQLYEHILNYIDNVCNIDVCKIHSLQSMIQQLGIQYSIFNDINLMPQQLRDLMEVLSIKKEYLLSSSIVNNDLIEFLSSNVYTEFKNDTTLEQRKYFDSEKLDKIIVAAYEKTLSSLVYLTYTDSTEPIWWEQKDNIYLSGFVLTNVKEQEIAVYKTKYGIRQDFDHVKIADEIELGITNISNYLLPEQTILQMELDGRKEMLHNSNHPQNLITRYSYHRERLVKQVFEFIENQYSQLSNTYLSAEQYVVDSEYLVIGKSNQQKKLLYIDDKKRYAIHDDMIHDVAQAMLELTNQIRYVRDDLKTQMQKNFIKGTYLLINFVVSEYVKNNTIQTLKKIQPLNQYSNNVTVSKIEYIDPTNYFNISTLLSNDINKKDLNQRYWESSNGLSTIAAIDTTNIFVPPPTIANNSFAFSSEDISSTYYDVLKFKLRSNTETNKYQQLIDFLSSTFDTGADKTFLSNGVLAIEKNDGTITTESCEVSADWYEYKKTLFTKYSGLSTALTPYAYSNEVHPSYQVHPFMSAFMETEDYNYPIDNIANLIATNMLDAIKPYLSSNELIDAEGYLQNIWKNPLNSNTDYLSRYEHSSHRDAQNHENAIIAYDGLFYPAALVDYLNNPIEFINSLIPDEDGRIQNKWYSGLDLSQNELTEIRNKLDRNGFQKAIFEVSGKNKKCYDIWQYGRDTFGNNYILVKDIDAKSINDVCKTKYLKRKSATGQLWIRKKDQPIAFPALIVSEDKTLILPSSQLSYPTIGIPAIAQTSSSKLYGDQTQLTPDIIDFTFDRSKKVISFLCKKTPIVKSLIATTINKTYSYDEEKYVITVEDIAADLNIRSRDFSTSSEFQHWSLLDNNILAFFTKTPTTNNYSLIDVGIFVYDGKWQSNLTTCILRHNGQGLPRIDHITTSNKVAIAYVSKLELKNNDSFVNYFNQIEHYEDISRFSPIVTSPIVVNRYQLSPTSLILQEVLDLTVEDTNFQKDIRLYNYHTHLGFYPLAPYNSEYHHPTIFQNTAAYETIKTYGFAKCQLFCPSVDIGIDFKFMLPVRMYESFDDYLVSSYQLSNISKYASFNYAHYNESNQLSNIVTEDLMYSPYELARVIQDKGIIQDGNIQLRVDESFFTEYSMESEIKDAPKYDQYAPYPFLVAEASKAYIEGHAIGKGAEVSNCCLFSLYYGENKDEISVSWTKYHHYSGRDVIKLDFNAQYYNDPLFIRNYYNRRHTFLNLDVPGYAGYLMTYDSQHSLKHIYFIKNVSDDVPKFLISADTYEIAVPEEQDIKILVTDGSNIPLDEISAIGIDTQATIQLGI